ncbi:MAG TPA: ATPase domain-containing protein [Candidatus Nanoarchaeia archaeon]|nr:ATPase domain-containing protein [Candidatus Nanoarchaeia archaeon]
MAIVTKKINPPQKILKKRSSLKQNKTAYTSKKSSFKKIEKGTGKSLINKKLSEKNKTPSLKTVERQYLKTGIPGFDDLFEHGIPHGNSVLVAGGAGSGKTIFCLQTLYNQVLQGRKCLYLSFEESEQRLHQHMEDFGWDLKSLKAGKNLLIIRKNPLLLSTNIEAMVAKAKGELMIDINEVLDIIPSGFAPEIIAVDSLSALAAAFTSSEQGYRIFIEQLFRYFEQIKLNSFFITETEQVPKKYSKTGTEEFLADGVVVLYGIKQGNVRENAIEVLKMRGERHQKKIVALQITNQGLVVYPEQEVFGTIG